MLEVDDAESDDFESTGIGYIDADVDDVLPELGNLSLIYRSPNMDPLREEWMRARMGRPVVVHPTIQAAALAHQWVTRASSLRPQVIQNPPPSDKKKSLDSEQRELLERHERERERTLAQARQDYQQRVRKVALDIKRREYDAAFWMNSAY